MRNIKLTLWLSAFTFAVLMSVPFLVPHLGWVALFGFVPLLMMDAIADAHRIRHFFWYHYAAFVLWNAFTTFWVCNATVGGGIFAVLANAVQMSAIWALFRLSKKRFGGFLPYVFLALLWIAWERWYFTGAQISWPWLALGNAFARSIRCIQWYEYTGVLGGSLWIWASNLCLFALTKGLMDGSWRTLTFKARVTLPVVTALILVIPFVVSARIWRHCEEISDGTLDVVIAQPNFDPYEKFVSMSQAQQNIVLLDLLEQGLKARGDTAAPVLLLAPETFTSDIVLGREDQSPTWQRFQAFLKEKPDASLIFGASTMELIGEDKGRSHTARRLRDGTWFESHNSAFSTDGTGRFDVFQKSKLVVGVEMMPYPAFFGKIDDLLGGVMGRCIGQDRVTTLQAAGVPLGCAVCYESVYGEYCTEYIKAGARALCVITNDAWWGDTPGYKQHLSYSCLRAIETRRDIARCANTGISGFINQRGEILSQSGWWVPEHLEGRINLSDRETFFVRHGDIVGRVCTFAALLLLLALVVRLIVRKQKREAR
ncbi:MAG: apolipoprotein N-acyltransferase [Bacteroidales bacterium]|nr:apolipoprotein N-acyltransferase [Bacteroidales bacterium]